MDFNSHEYWMRLLDKLNNTQDIRVILKETLEELCLFFEFGMGFIYEADYKQCLHLTGCYGIYANEITPLIEADTFNAEDLQLMMREKAIVFQANATQSELSEKLAAIFAAKSMVFVPIFDKEMSLLGGVGIIDRRSWDRHSALDIDFTRAVLTTLGVYIKMMVYQEKVENTYKALDSILNHMGIDVYVNDFSTHEILYLNRSMAAPYGKAEDLIGTICWQTLYDDKSGECDFCPKQKLLDSDGNPTKVYGWDYKRPFDGSWFRVLSAAFKWTDGRIAQVISSVDITENKRNEELIRHMAEYDPLTALPNRYRLTNDCDNVALHYTDSNKKGYFIFFDLDGFKNVNDSFGHDVGDELLAKVGQYLQENEMTEENSYRYGGDEFVVLVRPENPYSIDQVLQYLLQGFSQPWQLTNISVQCSASVGVSCFPDDSSLTSDLLRMADMAMFKSKNLGPGQVHLFNRGDIIPWQAIDN